MAARDPVPHPVTAARLRVAVLGTVMSNTGDAAILFGTIDALRRAYGEQPEVTIFDTLPEVCARHYPAFKACPWFYRIIERNTRRGWRRKRTVVLTLLAAKTWRTRFGPVAQSFLPRSVREALAELARADVVLAPGGTYLVAHYSQLTRLFGFLVAAWFGKPLIFYTQSIGPLPGGRDRRLMRFVLSRARLVLLRDERSERALRHLGLRHGRTKVTADAAFALASDGLEHRPGRKPSSCPRIALSVRDWRYFKTSSADEGMARYLSTIRGFCHALVERHGAKLTFLSTCQGVPEYGYDDSKIADRVVSALPEDVCRQVYVDRDFHTPEQLIAAFRSFDLLISTRMHGAILALCAGVPTLAIAYEFKSAELFARLGISERVFDIEEVTVDDLCAAATAVLGACNHAAADLWSRVARERDLARETGAMVRAVLDDR